MDIISIGAATVDIFAKSSSLPNIVPSSKNEISDGLICSGGGATNSSVSFARLGLKSTCASLVGNDPLKEYILNDLAQNKVDTSFLITNKNDTTDWSIILVSPDGSRSILTNRGSTRLEEKNINWDKIKKTKWFYITSLEGNIDLLEKLIGFAKENQIKVALNPGNRELKQSKRLLSLVKFIDVLLLNRIESEQLINIDFNQPDYWKKISSLESKITLITNSRKGAHLLIDDQNFYSPIVESVRIDETGAGDSFGSAVVAALFYNLPPEEALFWGIKNSASVVSFLGAKSGLLTLKQIKNAS